MATTLRQPCAGPNGSAVTNANATGGNQWNTAASTGAGTTNTYDNAATLHGNATAIKLHYPTVSATAYEAWKASIPTPTANAYARFYIYRTADPSVAGTRISHMLSGLGVAAAAVQVTTGGKLRIIDSAGTNVGTTSASLATSAWSRVEWEITGISGSTGTITARFYKGVNLDGLVADETVSSAGAAVTGNVNEFRMGCSTAITQSTAWDAWFSDAAWSDTAQPSRILSTSEFLMFA